MFKSGGAVLRPVGGGAGSLSVLWSAAKMAAGIMIIMPSINPTVVIIRIFLIMTWVTVLILMSFMNRRIIENKEDDQ